MKNKLFILIFSLFMISPFNLARAESLIDATTGVYESNMNEEVDYSEFGKQLETIEDYLKSGQVRPKELDHYTKVIINGKNDLANVKKSIDKDLGFVQKRIEALGEIPDESSIEFEAITKRRQQFNQEAAYYRAKAADVDVLLAQMTELDALISNVRNKELVGRLLEKQSPIVYPHNFFNSTKIFVSFVFDVIKSPITWYQNLTDEQVAKVHTSIIPIIIVIMLSFAVGLYLRLLIKRKLGYKEDIAQPKYITKVFAAFFVAIAYGAIPASIVAGFIIWLKTSEIMTQGFFGLIITSFLYYFLFIFLATAVSRVIFAPYNGKWRLINVSDEKAKKVKSALYLSIILIGSLSLLETVAIASSYPLDLIFFLSILSSTAKVFSFVIVSKRMFWDDTPSPYDATDEDMSIYDNEELSETGETRGSKVAFILSLLSIGIFFLALFGYPRLSAFILNRLIATFVIIGLFVIVRKATIEVLHRFLLLVFWTRSFRLRRKLIYKIDFWVGLVIDTLFIIMISITLLSLWGVPRAVLFDWIRKLLFGFNIGGIELSIISIALGITVFIATIAVFRVLKRRLLNNILSKMDIEDSIKYSLASGFGFIGFILAGIFAIVVMGGNLTSLALIAGALSLGIGLGLQNIVNNFVSGIILLFERPVKVGDWVVINNYEGLVKQVNIRATEVQIWNGSIVIIPNADFLANSVINYTLRDRQGRIEVPVSVAYGSDVDKVTQALLSVAAENKRVLKRPEPYVIFMRFGNTSLDFELRCFTADIMNRLSISSELRFAINRKFNEQKIQLAIPQVIYRGVSEMGNPPFIGEGRE